MLVFVLVFVLVRCVGRFVVCCRLVRCSRKHGQGSKHMYTRIHAYDRAASAQHTAHEAPHAIRTASRETSSTILSQSSTGGKSSGRPQLDGCRSFCRAPRARAPSSSYQGRRGSKLRLEFDARLGLEQRTPLTSWTGQRQKPHRWRRASNSTTIDNERPTSARKHIELDPERTPPTHNRPIDK